MTQEIKKLNVSGLAEHVLDAEAPTKDTLVKNPDYVEVDYTPATGISELWKQIGIWSGTVFGNVGGAAKINTTNFTLVETEDGSMHIAVANNAGKIASTADGIAMYYYKVPSSSTFTLTATMTINSFASNDQVSFGLMARDEIYVDENHSETIGDYVAAGPLKLTKSGSQWNCFARKSGVLTQGGTLSKDVAAGDVVDLKIESNSDGYACTYGTETAITGGFDFKLTTIDSDYVYVGMFVSRNADVTFSNIKLIVDGEEVVAGSDDTTTPGTGSDDTTTPGTGSDDTTTPGTGSDDTTTPGTGSDDTTTPSTGSDDTTTPSTDSDKTYSAVTVENLVAAEASSDAVAKDAAGNVVDIRNAKVSAKSDYVQAQKAEIDTILTNNGINLGANKLYYNVSLTDADGSTLTLAGGSVKITFAYPDGINADNYDFSVYHINTDGTVDSLGVTKTDNGLVVETRSFSPFVISYTLKSADTTATSGQSADGVKTGDTANPMPYVIMLGAAMLLVLGASKKKVKNN
jgi:hypothetical protein